MSCSSTTACTAVGSYTAAGPENSPDIPSFLLAERWNGATWTIQPTPGAGGLSGVSCPSVNACTAVGAGRIETWNGTTWTAVPTPATSDLSAVSCPSTAACTAVGRQGQTENWNGATWTVQPSSGGAGWAAVSCASANACLAARTDPTAAIADSWDGTSWTALPVPQQQLNPVNPFYSAVSCPAVNACTIVMNTAITSQFQSSLGAVAFRWDGAAWSTQQIHLPAGEDVESIGGISCPSATSCTAVGSYSFIPRDSPQLTAPLLDRWDGANWSAPPLPSTFRSGGPVLNGVSCASTTACMAVGQRTIMVPDGTPRYTLLQTVPYILSDP